MRVAVIGGGLIGLACAWRLAGRGHAVTLFDSAPEAREASWAAAGMLAPHHEAESPTDLWRLCCRGLDAWTRFGHELCGGQAAEVLDFHLRGGLLPRVDPDDDAIIAEKSAFLAQNGIPFEHLDRTALARREPQLAACDGALLLPAGQVDPRRTATVLRAACAARGVDLRYGVAVEALEPRRVLAGGEYRPCDRTVLASGAWTPHLAALSGLDVLRGEPVKGQLLRFAIDRRLLTSFVHCHHAYLVPRAGAGLVVGSTMVWSGFDKAEDAAAIDRLATNARRLLPALADAPIAETWTGLRPRLHDGQPLIDRVRDDLVIATGHFRNGILLAPLTAELVLSLVDA